MDVCDEIKDYLKENLSIKIKQEYYSSSVTINLVLDGEIISTDWVNIPTKDGYSNEYD